MKRYALISVVILATNLVAGVLFVAAFLIYLMKDAPILAAVPLLLALPALLLQPWFVVFFLFGPGGGFGAPLMTTLVSIPLYILLDKAGVVDRVKPMLAQVKKPIIVIAFGFLVTGLIAFARYIDFPAMHHGVPGSAALEQALMDAKVSCNDGRYYCLGAFIDSEWLWHVRVSEPDMNALKQRFGLQPIPANQVAATFQDMPPYWWQPEINDQVRVLSTPDFPLAGRGQDGWHALATWNPQDNSLHMWIKDNF